MFCVFVNYFSQDYFDIVKNPMDLSTIKRKLDTGQYQEPWQYVDDIWLMFNNAWLYNRKTSRVYKYCSKLAEVFEQEIDPVMRSLGYCCGRKVSDCSERVEAINISLLLKSKLTVGSMVQFTLVLVDKRILICPSCLEKIASEFSTYMEHS